MRKKAAGYVARALRAAANRLDPEPPHMEQALRLLGWQYDGMHWFYSFTGTTQSSSGSTPPPAPYGTIEWHFGTGEEE